MRYLAASVVVLVALTASSARAAINVFWQQNTISAAAIANDPALGTMQSWSLMVTQTDGTWASCGIRAVLPSGNFFYKNLLGGNTYPNPAFFAIAPALEFTSYARAQADTGTNNATLVLGSFPEGSPDGPSIGNQTQAPPGVPGNFNFSFGQLGFPPPAPGVPFEIVRLTFPQSVNPADVTIHPLSRTSQVNPAQDISIPAIPEPTALGLLAAAGLLAVRRRTA